MKLLDDVAFVCIHLPFRQLLVVGDQRTDQNHLFPPKKDTKKFVSSFHEPNILSINRCNIQDMIQALVLHFGAKLRSKDVVRLVTQQNNCCDIQNST